MVLLWYLAMNIWLRSVLYITLVVISCGRYYILLVVISAVVLYISPDQWQWLIWKKLWRYTSG